MGTYKYGDRVFHVADYDNSHGNGTIIGLSPEGLYLVELDIPSGFCHNGAGLELLWGHLGKRLHCRWVSPNSLTLQKRLYNYNNNINVFRR